MPEQSKDGGPAFPFPSGPEPRVNEFHDRCVGMSLRAWLTGQALPAIISLENIYCGCEAQGTAAAKAAQWAVEVADATIKALQEAPQ